MTRVAVGPPPPPPLWPLKRSNWEREIARGLRWPSIAVSPLETGQSKFSKPRLHSPQSADNCLWDYLRRASRPIDWAGRCRGAGRHSTALPAQLSISIEAASSSRCVFMVVPLLRASGKSLDSSLARSLVCSAAPRQFSPRALSNWGAGQLGRLAPGREPLDFRLLLLLPPLTPLVALARLMLLQLCLYVIFVENVNTCEHAGARLAGGSRL